MSKQSANDAYHALGLCRKMKQLSADHQTDAACHRLWTTVHLLSEALRYNLQEIREAYVEGRLLKLYQLLTNITEPRGR